MRRLRYVFSMICMTYRDFRSAGCERLEALMWTWYGVRNTAILGLIIYYGRKASKR